MRPRPVATPLLVMVSAGEASGDAHAAGAIRALAARRAPGTVTSFGMGAGALEAAGTELVVDCRDLAVIGFVDVALNYRRFLRRLERLRRALAERRPDVLLICDYPDFNLKLAETARAHGVPVLMYVAPQVWAWRAGRIPRIVSLVDHLAVLFPFETRLWTEAGAAATCVGHPALRGTDAAMDVAEARAAFGLAAAGGAADGPPGDAPARSPAAGPVLALLPGSRPGEIRRHLPPMLAALAALAVDRPGLVALLPVAPTVTRASIRAHVDEAFGAAPAPGSAPGPGRRPDLRLVDGSSTLATRAADVAIVASGTATLETALTRTPMVVIYRTGRINALIFRHLVSLEHVALPNIVVGREVVPELLQERATGPRIARAAGALLDDPEAARRMRGALDEVRAALGDHGDADAAVATLLEGLATGGRPQTVPSGT